MDIIQAIAGALAPALSMTAEDAAALIEFQPDSSRGDYSLPCFKFAKVLRKSPPMIAKDLAEETFPPIIARAEAVGPYVNFFTDRAAFARETFENPPTLVSDAFAGKTIVIDYSSPNIAKNFHVGHLRSTVIGGALTRIFRAVGANVVGVNHLGDWGTQFGKLIVGYLSHSSEKAVERGGISELQRVYVQYHEDAEKDPSLDDTARAWFIRLQNGDPEAVRLWSWFRELSLREFEMIYERLGVTFDAVTGESFYNDKMSAVVDELRAKNLLTESDGAMVVRLEDYGMPPCLILRGDGGTLYPTRDIAAAQYRRTVYGFDKCLYVTALDQTLHFAQWFKVAELMDDSYADKLAHIPFGLVSLPEGSLSTRKGRVVMMEDLLNEAVRAARSIIDERSPNLADKDAVAEKIGVGAVIFNDLYNNRIKDVVFSLERMISFEGETGPYLQYTYARASSVTRKAGVTGETNYSALSEPLSFDVVKLLSRFPNAVAEAAEKYEPYIISRYLIKLAQVFNRFYHEIRILSASESERPARLALAAAVKNVIGDGLRIIGVSVVDEM
ncbi:MAG: arginine--tRNA ligase [Clostridiales bacterium]|jgi:arginyl-tRNA synthetase|nr:arginine--tRNA ligase [Clostridiales bacterium]